MELQYLVREPQNITKSSNIIFMLHGYGSNEEDLFSFTPTLPEDWIVVSFRAPKMLGQGGFSWFDIDLMKQDEKININEARESLNLILTNIIKIKERYGITEGKTHLCGFSQGGILAFTLALKNPHLFNKIACLSCYPEDQLLENIVNDKRKLEHLRFFISHGTDDAIIPLEWGRKSADLLYDLSCYFSFREYMSGHSVNQKNYIDLMEFFKN